MLLTIGLVFWSDNLHRIRDSTKCRVSTITKKVKPLETDAKSSVQAARYLNLLFKYAAT